jgi:hypothetical protein
MSDKPLIIAIDSDAAQASRLEALVRAELSVDLIQAASVGEGLHALGDRVPDLVLTSPLVSPFDEGVLDEYLRALGPAGAHVQTLRIPVLNWEVQASPRLTFSLRRRAPSPPTSGGCDPTMFAREIAQYLGHAERERAAAAERASTLAPVASATGDHAGNRGAERPQSETGCTERQRADETPGSFQDTLSAMAASWTQPDESGSPQVRQNEMEEAYEIDLSEAVSAFDNQAELPAPDAESNVDQAYEIPASPDLLEIEEAMTARAAPFDD